MPVLSSALMANTLFVDNLPFKISDEQLSEHFASAGEVLAVTHIRQRKSGRSSGCGFVEMVSSTGSNKAVKMLNGTELGGRPLAVCLARP
ncbi:MAG: RNA-binding protein [Pedosphaera sp.]|nr:RNA-binding protein [Pedosphaera sp.]